MSNILIEHKSGDELLLERVVFQSSTHTFVVRYCKVIRYASVFLLIYSQALTSVLFISRSMVKELNIGK